MSVIYVKSQLVQYTGDMGTRVFTLLSHWHQSLCDENEYDLAVCAVFAGLARFMFHSPADSKIFKLVCDNGNRRLEWIDVDISVLRPKHVIDRQQKLSYYTVVLTLVK